MYEPVEDSKLLEKFVREHSSGSVLEIGTGSGIQAIAAAKNKKVNSVLAVDIQKKVIDDCKNSIKDKKIKFLVSDLFKNVKGTFDTIIFNPPYLPQELKERDVALEGGKQGYEVVEKFLDNANNYLKKEGVILLLFSSLTKKNKVDEFIQRNLLEFELLGKQHIFFEDLFVYKIKKSVLLKKIESKIENIEYFSKGKRGFIYTGTLKNEKVAIKVKNPKSDAISRVENEINFLKKLNKKNIGPKIIFNGEEFFAYKFIEGISFQEFLGKNNKKSIITVIKKMLEQLFILDKLKINKEEMSHPHKHILIEKNNPILIDFERSRYTINPANITQFCDYLTSKSIADTLDSKNIKINKKTLIDKAKSYKREQNNKHFEEILKEMK
ncbi:methyltransferase [Candidatus Woesearchaeota archaeon]|nr:methyltransferase [Candidatus Woesearchaeota archaeon]